MVARSYAIAVETPVKQFSNFTLERGNETATSDLSACRSCRSDVQEFHSKAPRDPSRPGRDMSRPYNNSAPRHFPINFNSANRTNTFARARKQMLQKVSGLMNRSPERKRRADAGAPSRSPLACARGSCFQLRTLCVLQPHSLQSFFVNVATVRQSTNAVASVIAAMMMVSCQST